MAKNTSINFTTQDENRIKWLRKHFGGIGQGAVITMALKNLYEQQKSAMQALSPNSEAYLAAISGNNILD